MALKAQTLRILPGQWRPQFEFEQVAWISPSWECDNHIWLDFPEAVFIDGVLTYLGHVSERFPSVYEDLPKAPWETTDAGLRFERELPNALHFAGELARADESAVSMEFVFTNRGDAPMADIALQTCAYVRDVSELTDYGHENVYVHNAAEGWVNINHALANPRDDGRFLLGWREGAPACDWPVAVCMSKTAPRGVAMTWFDDTLSLIGNPAHPCFHADPFIGDLDPGQSKTIHGLLAFFDGEVRDLDYERDLGKYAR